jgi:hypothetical protein
MGAIFADGAAGAAVAVQGTAFALLLGATLFLRRQFRRHGRIGGWSGLVTLAVLAAGTGLAAFAVAPLPPAADRVCAAGGAPLLLDPLARPPWSGAAGPALAAAVGLPVGLLARYRYRRGPAAATALGLACAAAVEIVQGTALLGLYPCPYRTAATGDVLLGGAGAAAGWLAGTAAVRALPRSWPGAVADLLPPGLPRRALGHALDLGLCWTGAGALTAVAAATGAADGLPAEQVRTAAFAALAAAAAVLPPLLRRDRCAPGRAALRLGVAAAGRPVPAPRPRALLRSVLLYAPTAALLAAGLPWWTAAVAAAHGASALVRRDGAGLADLIAGTRVTTRAALTGELPAELVRYAPPARPAHAPG